MGKALYRKYRSKSLTEIIGQEHITDTLAQALAAGKISHAYLFTGPRGVGKTSIARIVAHEINHLPYTDDSTHLDIIEIDAASNRRIDEIRDLREKVYVAPTSAAYKVYIIDEVHMLTKEAFNALLKTLEEPPAHVVFILATTDAHKLPDTIISRTQRYSFRPVESEKVAKHLKQIAELESISISDEALALLAEHGEGSFRDSISLLDQAANSGAAISAENILQMLGIPAETAITELLSRLTAPSSIAAIAGQLNALYEQGYQATAIASRLSQALRELLVSGAIEGGSQAAILLLLGSLLEVAAAYNPERYLEILLLSQATVAEVPSQSKAAESTIASAATHQPPDITQSKQESTPKPSTTKANQAATKKSAPDSARTPAANIKAPHPSANTTLGDDDHASSEKKTQSDESLWPAMLNALKVRYNTLYGVIRMAQPTFIGSNELQLAFGFAFHQKRVSDPKNMQILATCARELSGRVLHITCILDPTASPKPSSIATTPVSSATELPFDAISSIFGGAEIM